MDDIVVNKATKLSALRPLNMNLKSFLNTPMRSRAMDPREKAKAIVCVRFPKVTTSVPYSAVSSATYLEGHLASRISALKVLLLPS